ncbi:MAG TPA: ribosomal protein S18-alanine N-acetyltransferase [Nitriliruptorales bacterium]
MAADALDRPTTQPMGGSVRVSPMRRRHLDAVVAIEHRAYPRPWPRRLFEAELDKPGRHYLVARDGRRVVGYGGVLYQAGDVHLTTVAVDPSVQGRRVAGRLVHELVLVARTLTADGGLTLEVRAGNRTAQRLYRSFGFGAEGRRPGYYADNGEDAVIMWLHDLHGAAASATLRRSTQRLAGLTPAPD